MEVSAIRALSSRPAVADGARAGTNGPVVLAAGQLIEALGGPATTSAPRRFLQETLMKEGSLAARLLAQNAMGEALLDIGGTRFLVRLPEQRQVGETLVLTVRGGRQSRADGTSSGAATGTSTRTAAGADAAPGRTANAGAFAGSGVAARTAGGADLAGAAEGLDLHGAGGAAAGAARAAAMNGTPAAGNVGRTGNAANAAYGAAQDGVDGFSRTAQLLTRLAALVGAAPADDAQTPQAPKSLPALNAPVSRPEALAAALDQSISTSGMFYEAHLARWAKGDYPLARLSQEPQFDANLGGARDLGPAGKPGEGPPVIAERLAPLVAQQLATLENQTVTWNGQFWPGQAGRLEIQPDPPYRRDGSKGQGDAEAATEDGQPLVWITRLTLDLPHVGHVEALLALRGQHVALSLTTDQSKGAARLSAWQDNFENALRARGLQSVGFFVSATDGKTNRPATADAGNSGNPGNAAGAVPSGKPFEGAA